MIPEIEFLQTGGTIDKRYPITQGAYAFEIGQPAVAEIIEQMKLPYQISIKSISKKDSQDLTEEDRKTLMAHIRESKCTRFIITHGTDTMIHTGLFLKDIPNKVIIISGSFIPACCKCSDASAQVGAAVAACQLVESGVYICMNGQIIPIKEAIRNKETGTFEYAKS